MKYTKLLAAMEKAMYCTLQATFGVLGILAFIDYIEKATGLLK